MSWARRERQISSEVRTGRVSDECGDVKCLGVQAKHLTFMYTAIVRYGSLRRMEHEVRYHVVYASSDDKRDQGREQDYAVHRE
jgi:hypothetical protein